MLTIEQVEKDLEKLYPRCKLLTRQQLSEYLKVSNCTLQRWANEGKGVPFIRHGEARRIHYAVRDVAEYVIASHTRTKY